jgi:hypothetical protein
MKKLRMDDLVVESFVTASGAAVRGTVAGHAQTNPSGCQQCPTVQGCDDSLNICSTLEGNLTCQGDTDCGTCYEPGTCDPRFGCGKSLDFGIC